MATNNQRMARAVQRELGVKYTIALTAVLRAKEEGLLLVKADEEGCRQAVRVVRDLYL